MIYTQVCGFMYFYEKPIILKQLNEVHNHFKKMVWFLWHINLWKLFNAKAILLEEP